MKRHPHSPLLLNALSGVLSEQKLTQQSLNTLVQAYSFAPGSYVAQALSAAYSEADRTHDQLAFDEAALVKTPGDTSLLADQAGIMDSLGKPAAAVALYEKSQVYGEDQVRVLKQIAGVYSDAHQTKAAIATTQKVVALRPEDAGLRGQLADMYSDAGLKPQAITLYQQAIALDPSQVALRDKVRLIRGDKPVLDLAPAIAADPIIAAAKTAKPPSTASTGVIRNLLDEGREVVYSDGATDMHMHSVVKIQDQSAVSHFSSFPLDVESSTSKVANLRARLIKPSGKVIYPDTDDASAEVDFPSLDVGDIIDVEYDVTDYQSGALAHNFWTNWSFDGKAQDVDLSQYTLITPKTMKLTIVPHGNVPQITQYDAGNWTVRQWKATDVAAKPAESESPPGLDVADWVDISTLGSWSDVVGWYTDLANSACTPDDTIRAKAAELTQGDTTDEQRIQHIVKFVRSLRYQSTPFRLSAYVPTDGKQVIRDLYGDCKDKAALLCSLLSSVGIQAQMILLSPRDTGITPHLPSPRFDHAIARMKTDKGWQWEDATADQMQYGYLPFCDQGVPALVIDSNSTDLSTSPIEDPSDENQKTVMNLDLHADGSIKGDYSADFVGNTAWIVRSAVQMVGAARHDQMIQGMTAEIIPGSASDGGSFTGIDSPDSNVGMKLAFHADNYAASTGSLLLVKLPWANDQANLLHELDGPTVRTTPLELDMLRGIQTDTVNITLPAGFLADSLEKPAKISSKWGECDFGFATIAGGVTATRSLRIDAMRVPLDEIPGFVAFLKQITIESNKQIVVKSAS